MVRKLQDEHPKANWLATSVNNCISLLLWRVLLQYSSSHDFHLNTTRMATSGRLYTIKFLSPQFITKTYHVSSNIVTNQLDFLLDLNIILLKIA